MEITFHVSDSVALDNAYFRVMRNSTLYASANNPGFGTRIITERKYANCIELYNDSVRVVLEHNLGGRVLVYALNGNHVR